MSLTKLQFVAPATYNITSKKVFVPQVVKAEHLQASFNFSYDMSFAKAGHHRDHRTGGSAKRKSEEIFINAFQGKLAEFAFYQWLTNNGLNAELPDTRLLGEGLWDDADFTVNGKKVNIKSAAHFSNLLLLETDDWDANGNYKPNLATGNASYDFFVLVRIKPDGKKLMKDKLLYYTDEIDREDLRQLILAESWFADITGFATKADIQLLISQKHILPRQALLNGKIAMDASNYYLQSGDLIPMQEMLALF